MTDPSPSDAEVATPVATEPVAAQKATPDVLLLRLQKWVLEGQELSPEDTAQVAEVLRGNQLKTEVVLEVMTPHMARSARRTMGFLGMIEDRLFAPGRLDTMDDDNLIRLMHVTQARQQQTLEYLRERSQRQPAQWLRDREREARSSSLKGSDVEKETPGKRERMRQIIGKLAALAGKAQAQLDAGEKPSNDAS